MSSWLTQKYNIIYADPPWRFRTWSERNQNRSARRHYDLMTLAELKALDVFRLAADNCALFLWVTQPLLPAALEVVDAWNANCKTAHPFVYKTVAFYWVKTAKNGSFPYGLGYYTRPNPEQCWLFVRGKMKRVANDVAQLVVAPRLAHSAKPPIVRQRIVELFGNLPRLELFARPNPGIFEPGNTQGWQVTGLEWDGVDIREVLGNGACN